MIAKETGWTLDYIDSLSVGQLWEYLSVNDSDTKANRSWKIRNDMDAAAKQKQRGGRGRRR